MNSSNTSFFQQLGAMVALIVLPAVLTAQSITLTFDATANGTPMPLDSILLMNLSQGGDTTIYFPENQLDLVSVGINEGSSAHARMRALPNPFAGSTDVVFEAKAGDLFLTLHDATGRTVASYTSTMAAGSGRFLVTCQGPGVHLITAMQGGTRRTLKLMATAGAGAASLTPSGSISVPKADRSLFNWLPGDVLRYIGYTTVEGVLHSAAIDDIPTVSSTRTFVLAAGSVCKGSPTVADIDGNVYPAVVIGEQCWMAADLRTARYNDGVGIPNVTSNTAWSQLESGAWCHHDNDTSYEAIYGKHYNGYAAVNPNICPLGWHVPTVDDWELMEAALGMPFEELEQMSWRGAAQNVGGKLKALSLWNAPNTGATDQSGFSALASSYRISYNGYFGSLGTYGYFWTSTSTGPDSPLAWSRYLGYDNAGVYNIGYNKKFGLCVRCVKD